MADDDIPASGDQTEITRRDEIVAFFMFSAVLVPGLTAALIGLYGLLVWMFE